jgi:hypothetical protein
MAHALLWYISAVLTNMKKTYLPAVLAVAGLFLGAADQASAFPRTKEQAILTLTFDLTAPPQEPPPASPATGTATIDVTRENGVETASDLSITTTNLADGTYEVEAILKSDTAEPPVPVLIGSITVAGATPIAALPLPDTVKALDIEVLNVVTPGVVSTDPDTIVLTGTPTEAIEKWTYFANRPVTASDEWNPAQVIGKNGKPKKTKRIHGHVLIQAKIFDGVEKRRKFLLVAHNGPADTELTIRLDGVDAGKFTTTKNGKMMAKSLEGVEEQVRLAGVHKLEIVDVADDETEEDLVVAVADFFPNVE